jgi:hypothetical protein
MGDEVREGLMLREMWRSLEMVMSSFDKAKFSAWGFWSALCSWTRLNPSFENRGPFSELHEKKTSKTSILNQVECEECLSQMAKEFFTARNYLARDNPSVLTSLSAL